MKLLRMCPWCASLDVEVQCADTGYAASARVVICNNCGAHGPHTQNSDADTAIERWNMGGLRGDGHEGWAE